MEPHPMNRVILFGASMLLGLAACKVGPNHVSPSSQSPGAWPAALEAGLTADTADLREWWRSFNDPLLDSLVERALAGNPDLRDAAARVREARALREATGADRFPAVNAGGSAAYRRASGNTFGGPNAPPGAESDLYEAGFDATWEADLFGRVRRSVEAADADLGAAVESERDARVVLVAEVARAYVEFRSAQARLAIGHRNVQTQQETLDLSRERQQAGLATDLDVSQALAQLDAARAQLPTLAAAMKRAAFRLDVLLALRPGTLASELDAGAPVPTGPDVVSIGLPAELLRRRPDIRRAEQNLIAATARVGVAMADQYPRLTLGGSFGVASGSLADLFESDSRTWAVGPFSVQWPLFDAGRIRARIRVHEARQEQAIVAYEKAVLGAYEEVANALVVYARVRERRDALARAVQSAQHAEELANDLWLRGLTDFLNVLDTQRTLYQFQDQLAESEAAVATSLVALYKALGGGWEETSCGVPRLPHR
jgi:multidrug efflux system outer membrane protein